MWFEQLSKSIESLYTPCSLFRRSKRRNMQLIHLGGNRDTPLAFPDSFAHGVHYLMTINETRSEGQEQRDTPLLHVPRKLGRAVHYLLQVQEDGIVDRGKYLTGDTRFTLFLTRNYHQETIR